MISYTRLRKELGLKIEQDAELAIVREEVLDLWERATGRPWRREAARVDEFLTDEDHGVRTLWLRLWPVSSITTIQIKGSESDVDWDTLTTLDWLLYGNRELRRIGRYWERLVRVTYVAGHTDDTAPEDVLRALVTQAKFMRERFQNLTTRSQNFEGGAGVYEEADLHPYFKAAAARHARKI